MNKNDILIDNQPHRLLVSIDNDYSVRTYAIPSDLFEQHALYNYNGHEDSDLPDEILEAIEEGKFETLSVASVISI